MQCTENSTQWRLLRSSSSQPAVAVATTRRWLNGIWHSKPRIASRCRATLYLGSDCRLIGTLSRFQDIWYNTLNGSVQQPFHDLRHDIFRNKLLLAFLKQRSYIAWTSWNKQCKYITHLTVMCSNSNQLGHSPLFLLHWCTMPSTMIYPLHHLIPSDLPRILLESFNY